MADAGAAIGSLGQDLSFTVSFVVARELMAAASASGLSDDETIALLIAVGLVLASVPASFAKIGIELKAKGWWWWPLNPDASVLADLEFLGAIWSLLQRIVISLSVQLLAASVAARTDVRSVRVVSLLSVSVFFLFLESASKAAAPRRPPE